MLAGTAPFLRIVSSSINAVSKFLGYGIPWEIMVDSKATTACLPVRAFCTSGCMSRYDFTGYKINLFLEFDLRD